MSGTGFLSEALWLAADGMQDSSTMLLVILPLAGIAPRPRHVASTGRFRLSSRPSACGRSRNNRNGGTRRRRHWRKICGGSPRTDRFSRAAGADWKKPAAGCGVTSP